MCTYMQEDIYIYIYIYHIRRGLIGYGKVHLTYMHFMATQAITLHVVYPA